jgi:GT2 family glycosyltransferase
MIKNVSPGALRHCARCFLAVVVSAVGWLVCAGALLIFILFRSFLKMGRGLSGVCRRPRKGTTIPQKQSAASPTNIGWKKRLRKKIADVPCARRTHTWVVGFRWKLRFRKKIAGIPFARRIYARLIVCKSKLMQVICGGTYQHITSERQEALEKHLCQQEGIAKGAAEVVIDVSIVMYNSSRHLKKLLASLNEQAFSTKNLRLIFIDNNSADDTVARLREFKKHFASQYHDITLIALDKNIGFASGHNKAFTCAKGKFFLVANPDMAFESDAILNAVSYACTDDLTKVASWEFRQKPYEHPKIYDPVTMKTFWSSGACILFNPEAFKMAGGYDKKLFMYGEDVELSYRLIELGWQLKYCPFATVWHYTYKSAGEFKPVQFQGSLVANGLIRLRYGNLFQIITAFSQYPALLARELFRGGKDAAVRSPLVVKAYLSFLRHSVPFVLSRKNSKIVFPFNRFDYSAIREGSFYEHQNRSLSKNYLVSIIMRTHGKQEFWLRESITSVFNQTYKNIELIIVEDGGENAKQFVESIANRNPSVKLRYLSLGKVGRSAAGNHGLEQARGDLVMFLDSDDYLFSEHVEVLVDELDMSPDVGVAYTLAWTVPTKNMANACVTRKYKELQYYVGRLNEAIAFDFDRLKEFNILPIQAALFRREVYERCGGFDVDLDLLEDWNLWLRYAHFFKFKMIPKLTSAFRTPADVRCKQDRDEGMRSARIAALSSYEKHVARQ